MDRMLYVAMSGAREMMRAQAQVANNLANVNTAGFRADLSALRALPVYGPGHPARAYTRAEGTGMDLGTGTLISTGSELDVAVAGRGYIAVQGPDGREAYTRAGNLQVSENGLVTTGAGWPVLGNGGPIAIPPAEKIEIGADGTISVLPVGQEASTLAVVDRIKLVDPPEELLEKNAAGLLQLADGTDAFADAGVTLVSGELEASNVNAVEQMVAMLDYARQFEMQVKMMDTARRNGEKAAELMRIG